MLVFGDSTVAYKPIDGEAQSQIQCRQAGWSRRRRSISELDMTRSAPPRDKSRTPTYNFKKPSVDLTVQKDRARAHDQYEIYDYPGNYGYTEERTKRLARIRLDAAKTFEELAKGDSNCPRLSGGLHLRSRRP